MTIVPSPQPVRAHCHALRVRLDQARADALARPEWLWVEPVPSAAGGPVAARRLAAELARPVSPNPGRRAVLLRYCDGPADLVLVAHRAALDRPSLRRLADSLLGGLGDFDVGQGQSVPTSARFTVEWGMGDPRAGGRWGTWEIAVADGDPAGWVAALVFVLGRYRDQPQVSVAVVGASAAERDGSVENGVLLSVDTSTAGTLGDLVACLRGELATAQPSAPAAEVGILFDPPGESPTSGDYLPCLAPLFPLTVTVGRGPTLRCDYDLRDFSTEMITQFAGHLVRAQSLLTTSPQLPLSYVELLDPAERDRVIALGQSDRPLRSTPALIHREIARRVAERPDAVALSYQGDRLSYLELDRWSDRLAHGLRTLEVQDGDRVGVCAQRSTELVVVLLAVLKAGAVAVPLDPDWPAARLSTTAADARLGVVVSTQADFPTVAQVVTPAQLGDLGTDCQGAPASAVTPDDPAYIIYTSGSTGRPKGVVVPHRNVVSLLDATRPELGLGFADVWTLFHSSAFDFSVWEIWGCLLTGGHLVIVPYWVARSAEQFHQLLAQEQVTVLSQTPSAFTQLLEADLARPEILAVRLVVFGGEPLNPRMLLPWFDRHPESDCRVLNMFGITETTVHVTAETVTRGLALEGSRSVGRALPGWFLYVLDSQGRLLPPGVVGEIYVGGAGVALHYLHRPELTAQRFHPDPFRGGRMYRSGDRGRLRPDGRLEHLGRLDSQLKIRGYRIEPDEIRAVLLETPTVVAAAVVPSQLDPLDPATARLGAYVVLSGGSTTEVRHQAARVLPDYMMPATITALAALPLTTNGKLDIAQLSAAPVAVAPRSQDQVVNDLLDVWHQVLGVPVGQDDDFFALGGNSLLAMRLSVAMRERGLPAVHPRVLYLNSTVRRLREVLDG